MASALPTLLLLHPDLGDLAFWDATLPGLRDHFHILKTDLRAAQHALAFMNGAGVDRAGVVGIGLGVGIAIDLAMLAPERVQAVALMCSSAPRSLEESDKLRQLACPTLVIGTDNAGGTPSVTPGALASELLQFFLKPQTVIAAEELLYESGLANRRRVLGDAYVDQTLARRTSFNAEFQAMITRIAWHEIYSRPGLDLRTRRLIVLAVTAATARWEEFRLHVRAAVASGGLSRDDVKELLMQLAIYAGVPAANSGFAEASAIFESLDRTDGGA